QWLVLYLTRTRSRFRNAFGILCSSFLICNLQAIFVLLTWCTIVLSLKSPILSSPKLFSVRLVGVFLNGACYGQKQELLKLQSSFGQFQWSTAPIICTKTVRFYLILARSIVGYITLLTMVRYVPKLMV
ncbi:hypothetical protein WUBG_13781, partial [Wuchereria bancrofti]